MNHSVWNTSGTSVERAIAGVAARGWIGVPIFFVISGYCIAAAVDNHRRSPGRSLRSYFTRRLRRIYPPYWAVLLGTMAVVALVDVGVPGAPITRAGTFLRPWWYDARQWIGSLTLTEVWLYHVVRGQKALILGHAWTLCYEEQFYIVSGVLLWLAPRRFFLGAAGVTVAVVAIWAASTSMHIDIDGFFFDGSWLQFWMGIALFHALNYGTRVMRAWTLAAFVAVAAIAASDPTRLLSPDKNVWETFFVAGAFAALALLLFPWDGTIDAEPGLSVFRTCGVMCYSLYLVHLPIVNLLRTVFYWYGVTPRPIVSLMVCVPISLVLAWQFHVRVERRFLNRPSAPERTPLRPLVPAAIV
jgi:peptidoglycan/LPS O-acetylase OafA/YrhL